MPEFTVVWEIDSIDADTHAEAARKARAMQLDPESTATVFEVYHPMPGVESRTIDLSTIDETTEEPADPDSTRPCGCGAIGVHGVDHDEITD